MTDLDRNELIRRKGYRFETDKEEAFYILGIRDAEQSIIVDGSADFDDDDFDDDTPDEPDFECFDCACGAWEWSVKAQRFIHCADCICGSSEPFS